MATETASPQYDLSYELDMLRHLEKSKRDELIKKIEEEERIEEDKLKNNPNLLLERKIQAMHDELKDLKNEMDIMRNSLNIFIMDDKINCKVQCPYLKSQTPLTSTSQPQSLLQCSLQQNPQKHNLHKNIKSHVQVYDDDDYDDEYDNKMDWVYWFFGISLILLLIVDLIPPNKCIRPFTI